MKLRPLVILAALLFSALGHAAEVRIFAAASLTDALKEIGAQFAGASGDKPIFNFGASNLLARQIEEGAPADVFFSADEPTMDSLQTKGRIVGDSRRARLSNSLAIIVAAENGAPISAPADLASTTVKRLALANPKIVPAGVYARQYLESLGLWSAIAPKVVPTENVRGALAAVESGNVEAGIVYKTDAAISRKVKIAFLVPVKDGPAIRYPVAIVKDGPQPEAARRFLEYLSRDAAVSVFERFGFVVLP